MNNAWYEIEKYYVEVMYCQTYAAFLLFPFPDKAICKDCFDLKIPELPFTPESVAEGNPEVM